MYILLVIWFFYFFELIFIGWKIVIKNVVIEIMILYIVWNILIIVLFMILRKMIVDIFDFMFFNFVDSVVWIMFLMCIKIFVYIFDFNFFVVLYNVFLVKIFFIFVIVLEYW